MTREIDVKALLSHIVRGDGLDRCRICMGDTSEGQVFLEDTVMVDGNRPVPLSELLETITGIEVQLEDDLPSGLCHHCVQSTFAAAHFRYLCHHSTFKWCHIVQLLEKIPTHDVSNLDSMYAIIKNDDIYFVEHEIKSSSCDKTKPVIKDAAKTFKKKTRKHISKVTNCQCPDCGKMFLRANNLFEHFLESTEDKKACYVCASIMSREDLIIHLRKVHGEVLYGCKKCPGIFQTGTQYKHHLQKAHCSGGNYCGDCGQSFQSVHAYSGHCVKHLAKSCPGCNKLFRNRRCYVHHVKECCNLDKNRKDMHRTKHTSKLEVLNNERKVKVGMRGSADETCICDYCQKPFAGKKYVRAHIEIVHMKTTHRPCPYCGKSLASAHMTQHMKRHEVTKSFTCEHCGVVLHTKLGYLQHIRLHTGEKPYVCKFCPEAFSASSRRSEHVRKVHKKSEELVLKHVCQYCPAKFRLPFLLKKHIESVHRDSPEQNFECSECHIKFSSCRGLVYHMRKHEHETCKPTEDNIKYEKKDVEVLTERIEN